MIHFYIDRDRVLYYDYTLRIMDLCIAKYDYIIIYYITKYNFSHRPTFRLVIDLFSRSVLFSSQYIFLVANLNYYIFWC